MERVYDKLKKCYEDVRKKTDFQPDAAIVLGSGLGGFAEKIDVCTSIDYHEIEGFPVSTVQGHKGRFLFGTVGNVKVVAMQGRVHYYEGYPMSDVVLPIRLMGMLGAKSLILTNAAGGVNETFHPGDLMLIEDQISSFVPSPLVGQNIEELGVRFPDMSAIYDRNLIRTLEGVAKEFAIPVKKGVYIQFTGPAYESPAEVRMSRIFGADAVGMSTACEAVAARHMGMKVCGISCISNMASGVTKEPLSHEEVQKAADKAAPQFTTLLTQAILRMGKESLEEES
ncbi:purine-nucleoside phosphorylase [Lachnoclostridium sp. An181]|uniref:purine-nucleoside phosphorylase n=1 Tax=Lachnoclostridium sp. An181 TaxID=1965575 RepID=UPI000B385F04|nr:purine-nucleoside phosphorylase [Lachnoclostridium sp. An181]